MVREEVVRDENGEEGDDQDPHVDGSDVARRELLTPRSRGAHPRGAPCLINHHRVVPTLFAGEESATSTP